MVSGKSTGNWAVDIIMPDLQKCGGLGEGQRIANLANLYYKPFSPHMVASLSWRHGLLSRLCIST